MEPPPWLDDLADDLQSISFTSTATTTTTLHRSTSSGSSSATLTPAPSTHTSFSSKSTSKNSLSLSDLRFSLRLGSGDIGSVYLVELKAKLNEKESPVFAAKIMDKKELVSRSKEGRARTEREILETLDHPFLPTLYTCIDSNDGYCSIGCFSRFFASEVIVALEYLHMMGIVYRDLKPENVLVRSDGHIMLTDFDLSLKCDDSTSTPQIISNKNHAATAPKNDGLIEHRLTPHPVSCFHPKRNRKKKTGNRGGPEFVAEPVDVRSMSFVGTHEYLAPEIVSGIFMFELFYGVTPFRGVDHELTLANIVARALEFPKEPAVPAAAKDLISQLLVKDPARRTGSTMGASAVKHHPFFQGVNWALLRCTPPPYVPPPFNRETVSDESCPETPVEYY
ncbi:serine/threonine-protein kinase [Salix suchowensis]|nr:serine/threonine-protein kinase [Salix suchowensis]